MAPGLTGCVLEQNPDFCQSALENLPAQLQNCPPDESGLNCVFNALYDALGLAQAAGAVHELVAQCAASPIAPICELIRTSGGGALPDRLPVASESLQRGGLLLTPAPNVLPSAKSADGMLADWSGEAGRIGGTARYDRGEHIYSDYLFDAYGADDGDDARRLALTLLLGDIYSRTQRIDQLFQALGDQFGAPRPLGAPDHYGDAVDLEDGLDLLEVRWAASPSTLHFLARTVRLLEAGSAGILILADTEAGGDTQGLNIGLRRSRFDRAVLLSSAGAELINLRSGTRAPLANAMSVNASAYDNAIEAVLPRELIGADGQLRVAVASVRRNANGSLILANLAYRFDEPVAGVYNEREQALALFNGDIDRFTATIDVNELVAGKSDTVRPGPGYHERIFTSGENISDETRKEDGLFQHYGLYVPRAFDASQLTPLTFWLHYRGGKAHSGGAWTPRLINQLGEEQNNLVVTPRGRGTSTWYVTAAHQDFFEVFADAHALFPSIDPQRRYLSGYSMGGHGTYLFGLLYPDLFAAGYPTSGSVTQGAWTGVGPDDPVCGAGAQEIPEVGDGNLCFVEANDGDANAQLNYRLLENARHFPIVIHHGSNDELALTPGAERMALRLLQLGYRYDMTTFLGYEHYTQAILDEWADGAAYLNRYRAPENPREVTYKVVPALVRALNTVQSRGVSFDFRPDGAYWLDGVTVRDANPADTTQFGMIEAESEAIAAPTVLPVPGTGNDPADPTGHLTTPVFSPGGHSTPFVRHGQDWIETGAKPVRNAFSAELTRLAAATLDLARMNLNFSQAIEGTITTDGASALTLSGISSAVTLCVDGIGSNVTGNQAVAQLGAGQHNVNLLPGFDQTCPPGGGAALVADQPDLGDVCRAYAVEPGTDLCDLLEDTHQQLEAGCEVFGASQQVCSLFGGNLHALIDACYQNDLSDSPLCKVADTFVQGAASYCRQLADATGATVAPQVCALLSGELIAEATLRAYEDSWTHRALQLQYELGAPLRFVDSTFVSTHNTFNATDANTPPTLSGSDPNQRYDSVGQLRMDVRAIEIDVHWMPRLDGSGFAPTVCHGNAFHFGCTYEKDLETELREIRAWMNAHPDQVVLLYLENNLNEPLDGPTAMLIGTEQYREAAGMIERTLGDILYRPVDHGSACGAGHPLTAGINSLRAAGKRVYIQTEGCDAGWAALVFNKEANGGATHDQSPDESQLQAFSMDGMCGGFTRAEHESKWTRYFEDGTLVGALTGFSNGELGSAEDFRGMVRCGVNMPSMDHVTPLDPRLPEFIWSWAQDEPRESEAVDCALHTREGRFVAADCAAARPYACLRRGNTDGDPAEEIEWQIAGAGAWAGGAAACPAGFVFGVPGSGYQNELLKLAKEAAAVTEVWLNYSDSIAEGNWVAP